jgi:hypothetical protein
LLLLQLLLLLLGFHPDAHAIHAILLSFKGSLATNGYVYNRATVPTEDHYLTFFSSSVTDLGD